jgi:hypothetical protein
MPFTFNLSLRAGQKKSHNQQQVQQPQCQKRHCQKEHCTIHNPPEEPHIVHHCGRRHSPIVPTDAPPAKEGRSRAAQNAKPPVIASNPLAGVNDQSNSPLFNLPAELRMGIYPLVFQNPHGTADFGRLPAKHHLALLQTCRRILLEAEDIYYTLHRFIYNCGPAKHTLYNTARLLSPPRIDAIEHLTIFTSNGGTAFGVVQELHHLPNLRTVVFERGTSVEYINLDSWNILKRQMIDSLKRLEKLEEVKIITPEPRTPRSHWTWDHERKRRVIDDLIMEGWKK